MARLAKPQVVQGAWMKWKEFASEISLYKAPQGDFLDKTSDIQKKVK